MQRWLAGFDLEDERGECPVGVLAGAVDGAGDAALAAVGAAARVDLELPAPLAAGADGAPQPTRRAEQRSCTAAWLSATRLAISLNSSWVRRRDPSGPVSV